MAAVREAGGGRAGRVSMVAAKSLTAKTEGRDFSRALLYFFAKAKGYSPFFFPFVLFFSFAAAFLAVSIIFMPVSIFAIPLSIFFMAVSIAAAGAGAIAGLEVSAVCSDLEHAAIASTAATRARRFMTIS